MDATRLDLGVSWSMENNNGPWPYTHGWTTQDVENFIHDIGFPEYTTYFKNNAVDGKQLACLTAYDLQRCRFGDVLPHLDHLIAECSRRQNILINSNFGVSRMEHAIVIIAYIKEAVQKRLFSYENPQEPPRHSYLSPQQWTNHCPQPCTLPPVSVKKPFVLRMTSDDLCLPERNQEDHYRRRPFHSSLHKQCSVLSRTNVQRDDTCWARTPSKPLCCLCHLQSC